MKLASGSFTYIHLISLSHLAQAEIFVVVNRNTLQKWKWCRKIRKVSKIERSLRSTQNAKLWLCFELSGVGCIFYDVQMFSFALSKSVWLHLGATHHCKQAVPLHSLIPMWWPRRCTLPTMIPTCQVTSAPHSPASLLNEKVAHSENALLFLFQLPVK